jgi:tetratricopeptide (TPR) repeat protein
MVTSMMRDGVFSLAIVLQLALPALAQTQSKPQLDLCVVPPGAQPLLPARLMEGQGKTDMPVTTRSEEARRFFNQGVAQMHSFWTLEAERSFLQAAALDPHMAMAYWGMALAAGGDYRPAFQLLRGAYEGGGRDTPKPSPEGTDVPRTASGAAIDSETRARENIAKAMSLRDKVTERERLYIEALAVRRAPKLASKERDAAYIASLRKLVAAYPDDLEAKSMLGLALLDGYDAVTRKPRAHTLEGLALLEEVVVRDDAHFGAHHYLIHGYEGSERPDKAWYACKRYPELVPNIPHALHMPGHIYAQSDRIDDAIASFSAAADNELSYLNADLLFPNGHHAHNVHFLIHSLNLDGRFKDSMERVRHVMSFKETPREREGNSQRTAYRQGYFSLIKTLVRFERWDLVLDGTTIPVYDKPEQQAWRHWALGLAQAYRGSLDDATAALAELVRNRDQAQATQEPIAIAAQELEATIAARLGDREKAREIFRKAAERETAQLYTEPPAYPRPVVEGQGNLALLLGDFASAEAAYREALEREPGGGRAYFGLAAALEGLGRSDEARSVLERASQAWSKADPDLAQMERVTAGPTAGRGNP